MINLKQELQNFKAIDIKALEARRIHLTDSSRNSILLYNKAIESLKMNSEDIAVIELKKALALNPGFEEALHLLGVCYCYIKDYSKAEEVFKRLNSIGNKNISVSKYIGASYTGKSPSKSSEINYHKNQEPKNQRSGDSAEKKAILKPGGTFTGILNGNSSLFKYIACLAAGAVVMFLVLLPILTKPKTVQVVNNKAEDGNKTPETVNKDLENKYHKVSEDFKKVQQDLETSKIQLDYYKNVQKLFEVEALAAAREYEAAADTLVLLKGIEFKAAAKEKYDSLSKEVMPKAAWAVYTQGNNFFNAKRYPEAIAKLSKVQAYGTDWQYMAWTLYQLGICYKETNDVKNALAVFQNIKQNYAHTEYAGYSEYRIKELGGTQ